MNAMVNYYLTQDTIKMRQWEVVVVFLYEIIGWTAPFQTAGGNYIFNVLPHLKRQQWSGIT